MASEVRLARGLTASEVRCSAGGAAGSDLECVAAVMHVLCDATSHPIPEQAPVAWRRPQHPLSLATPLPPPRQRPGWDVSASR